MALTADRNTPMRSGEIIPVPVAASSKIYAGSIVVANASGYAVKGSKATGLTYLGRAEEQVDNSSGSDGDIHVLVRRNRAFKWKNFATSKVTQAEQGKSCYIEDDETVAKASAGRSVIGKVLIVEDDGVWVE